MPDGLQCGTGRFGGKDHAAGNNRGAMSMETLETISGHARARGAPVNGAPIPILGVPFDNVTTAQAVGCIEEMVASRRPHYLVTANVDFLVLALNDVELRRILFEAHLVLCDGTPLLWASRLLGNPLQERVAGSDLVPLLIRVAAEKRYRIFFLGGSPETASAAVARLQGQYPSLLIAGHYSPPFQPLLEMEHEQIRRRIEEAKPDILFVSFGAPKQEKFIAMHFRTLGVPVSVGVGGTIDFLAGSKARAPLWMQRTGTEWVFRLLQEPRRLFGRYLRDLCCVGGPLAAQWWQLQWRPRKRRSLPEQAALLAEEEESWTQLQFPPWVDMASVQRNAAVWENIISQRRNCLVDLSKVQFIDSTGVGLLIRLHKSLRLAGRHLFLVGAREAVLRALRCMRLEHFFQFAPDFFYAKKMAARQQRMVPALVRPAPRQQRPLLFWRGEITAANAVEVWEVTERFIIGQRRETVGAQVDLSAVRFLDSTAVGLMVRAKKLASRQGLQLGFRGLRPDAQNVLRLCRLEAYLLES
jgi:N-acetylglucosaminyldiphosphoundecaprenol N-acetyl-beta-D-mannosaminyltransferase